MPLPPSEFVLLTPHLFRNCSSPPPWVSRNASAGTATRKLARDFIHRPRPTRVLVCSKPLPACRERRVTGHEAVGGPGEKKTRAGLDRPASALCRVGVV